MIEINVCPSTLEEGNNTYSGRALKTLFDGEKVSCILPYNRPDSDETVKEIQNGSGRISLSGVQEKMSAVVRDGVVQLARKGEQGRYILKPVPSAIHLFDKAYMPANEHLSMQIASQVFNILTAANGLVFWQDGSPAYLTKRFDVNSDGTKNAMEDFAGLAGLTRANGGSDYKYCNLSYEECGDLIRQHVLAAPVEILKFFRVVVYNYLISNDDAHLKNFSIIERAHGDYVMAPAYDLINTFMHLGQPRIFALDKGLFKEGMQLSDTRIVNRTDFLEFGKRLGLNERVVKRELDRFCDDYEDIEKLISNSFLSDNLKINYALSFKYRRNTLRQ